MEDILIENIRIYQNKVPIHRDTEEESELSVSHRRQPRIDEQIKCVEQMLPSHFKDGLCLESITSVHFDIVYDRRCLSVCLQRSTYF